MYNSLILIVSIISNYHAITFTPSVKHLTGINRHTFFGSGVAITLAGSYLHPKWSETVKHEKRVNYCPGHHTTLH